MSDSQENIEAKLIAFVEGDLDAAGRAEIEQHLATNPTHRKLLDELMRTREHVRQLPRAKAPPELVETLQGHLERSALLDNMGIDDGGSLQMRSNRLPQLVSIAAVVLLALGLAAVVYMALPRDEGRPAIARTDADPAAATQPAVRATRPTEPSISTIAVVPPEGVAPTGVAEPARTDAVIGDVVSNVGTTTAPTTPAVVAMAGPRDTVAKKSSEPAPGAIAGAVATNEQDPSTLPTAIAAAAPAIEKQEQQLAFQADSQLQQQAQQNYDEALYVVVNAANPTQANNRVADYLASNRIDYQNVAPAPVNTAGNREPEMAAGQDAAPATQAGTGAIARGGENAPSTAAGAFADQGTALEPDWPSTLPSRMQRQAIAPDRVSQQFLVKRMTRQQVTDLQTAIAEPDVALIEPAAPPADALRAGDEVEITVNELVGPGVEKTNRARVSDDGDVVMPMVEPVKAAGLTPQGLSDAVARRYEESSLIENPTVIVARVAPAAAPTTQDVPAAGVLAQAQAAEDITPTTRPATTPTTQSTAAVATDAALDVMIVVQSLEPATVPATTLPATLPTAQPTTAPSSAPTPLPMAIPEPATLPAAAPETVPTTLPAATQPIPNVMP